MRPFLALAITVALGVATTTPAAASCMLDERPLDEQIAAAEVVFVGSVDTTEHGGTTARFEVEEVWTGADLLGDAVDVLVIGGSGQDGAMTSIDRMWDPGNRYLVFPYVSEGQLHDNSCTPTRPWDESLAAHRPADAVVLASTDGSPRVVSVGSDDDEPAEEGSGGVPPWAIVLAAVGVSGAAAAVVRGRQGDH